MPYKSIYEGKQTTSTENDYSSHYVPGQYAEVNKKIASDKKAKQQPKKVAQKKKEEPRKSFLSKLGSGAKSLAKGAVASEQAAATGIARVLPGGDADIQAQNEQAESNQKNLKFIKSKQKSGKIDAEEAKRLTRNVAKDSRETSEQANKTDKEMLTKTQVAAGFAGTGFDLLTAGIGTGGLKASKEAAKQGFKQYAKEVAKQSLKTAAVAAPAGGLATAASEKDASLGDIAKGTAIAAGAGAVLPVATEVVAKGVGKVAGKLKGKTPEAKPKAESKPTISEAEHQAEATNLSQHYDQDVAALKDKPSLTQKTERAKLEKDYQEAHNALDQAAGKEPTFVNKEAVEADKLAEKNTAEVKKIDDQVELIKAKKKDAGELSEVDTTKLKQLEIRKQELAVEAPKTPSPPLPRPKNASGKIDNVNRGDSPSTLSREVVANRGSEKIKATPEVSAGDTPTPKQGVASSRVYQRMKADHPDLKDDVSYDAIKLKEDSEKAVNLLANDKQAAFDIAMGAKSSPDVTSTATNIAMFEKAMDEGDYDLASRLVKKRSLDQTRRGQELVAEKASISDNSTGRYVKELMATKMEALGKKYLAGIELSKKTSVGQRTTKLIDQEVGKLERQIKAKKLDTKTALDLLSKMECL